tara:strand:- start:962 stop:1339 length:378 start_codon:yes stop_codon:yes gene_type:complete
MSNATNNDYLRSLLTQPLKALQQLEDNNKLILSFSHGICQLIQKTGGAVPLLSAVKECKINREVDPFADRSASTFDYLNNRIFFKISHKQNTPHIDIGLYSEIPDMRRQRNKYEWFALQAVVKAF